MTATNQTSFSIDTSNIDHLQKQLIDMAVQYGPEILKAVLILAAGFFVARWIGKLVEKWTGKLELEPPVRILMLRAVRTLVMLMFLLMVLQQLGFNVVTLIAGLGVAGAGVALAMQGVLSNLFAGLTIIMTKPFRVGEYIAITAVEGQVDTIDLFTTKLTHADRSKVVVPNRKIVGEILHNYGKIRQVAVSVGVAYRTDLNTALAVIDGVLKSNALVLKEPAPVVGVSTLANSCITISVSPWVKVPDYGPATAGINKAIVEAFREQNIDIPFPQHEVRLLNPAA